ncbi:hypothetical protein UM760_07545 [Staphylococcus aureus]|nr:hypothetical protein UM760_07545 [Staphylococcus aureus]
MERLFITMLMEQLIVILKYPLDNQNRQQKNNLFNGFTQAFNGFRGQQYNTVNINYNADSGKLTVNYAGLNMDSTIIRYWSRQK